MTKAVTLYLTVLTETWTHVAYDAVRVSIVLKNAAKRPLMAGCLPACVNLRRAREETAGRTRAAERRG